MVEVEDRDGERSPVSRRSNDLGGEAAIEETPDKKRGKAVARREPEVALRVERIGQEAVDRRQAIQSIFARGGLEIELPVADGRASRKERKMKPLSSRFANLKVPGRKRVRRFGPRQPVEVLAGECHVEPRMLSAPGHGGLRRPELPSPDFPDPILLVEKIELESAQRRDQRGRLKGSRRDVGGIERFGKPVGEVLKFLNCRQRAPQATFGPQESREKHSGRGSQHDFERRERRKVQVSNDKKNGALPRPVLRSMREAYFFLSVEVVAVVAVVVVAVEVVAEPVAAGVSVDVVVVVVVVVVAVEPVSSTTFGASLEVAVLLDSLAGSSAFLHAPRNRVAVAVAASRNRGRDFFIGR